MKGGKYRTMQTGGQYLLDGSWQPGYYDKKQGVWVDTGPPVPKQVSPVTTAAAPPNPLGDSPWLAKGQPNPLVPKPVTPVPIPMAPEAPGGWHRTPEDIGEDGSTFDERLPEDHPDNPRTGQATGTYASRSSVTETTTKSPHNWNNEIFFGLRGAQMAATYLSGKKRNNRMNEYDYKQQSALGQMNPMPISAFQYNENNYTTPNRLYAEQGGMMNPYSYHSKYGGNLKTILKDYKKWTNEAQAMDMGEGHIDNQGLMKKGGFALDELIVSDFIRKLMQFGRGPHPYAGMRRGRFQKGGMTSSQYNTERGLKDANDKGDFDNISPNKARQILHDKKVNGHPLTPEQNRLFGYLSKGHTLKFKK